MGEHTTGTGSVSSTVPTDATDGTRTSALLPSSSTLPAVLREEQGLHSPKVRECPSDSKSSGLTEPVSPQEVTSGSQTAFVELSTNFFFSQMHAEDIGGTHLLTSSPI